MADVVKQGKHGLFYLTDPDEPRIFIAASSTEKVMDRATIARLALCDGRDVPHHVRYENDGICIVVPACERMTNDQRIETTLLLQRHLLGRTLLSESAGDGTYPVGPPARASAASRR